MHSTDFKAQNRSTLGPGYNEKKNAKETARCKWVPVVTELINSAGNGFYAKKNSCFSRVHVITELAVSGTQCKMFKIQANFGNI